MPLRRLLNVVHAALCEAREADEIARLNRELVAEPGSRAGKAERSRNVGALMAAMQMPQTGAPAIPEGGLSAR